MMATRRYVMLHRHTTGGSATALRVVYIMLLPAAT